MLKRLLLTIGSLSLIAVLGVGCGTSTRTESTSPTGSSTPPPKTPPTTPPAPHLDHIAIAPPSLTVAPGTSFNFTATAFDQFNKPFTAPITWTSDGTPVTNGSGTAQNASESQIGRAHV